MAAALGDGRPAPHRLGERGGQLFGVAGGHEEGGAVHDLGHRRSARRDQRGAAGERFQDREAEPLFL